MKILIACEESQTICKEFRRLGHEAYSCDIQNCSGGHPEWHFKQDVLQLLQEHWDIIIAHPPCTYLSNAGARWLYAGKQLNTERYTKGIEAKKFFMTFFNCSCEHIAIENPIPSKIYQLPFPSQIIQPYEFGEPWSKKTCLWLKGLPTLKPTDIVQEYKPYCTSSSYSKTRDQKYKGFSRKGGSAKSRSKTFVGIAKAMAIQWSEFVEKYS